MRTGPFESRGHEGREQGLRESAADIAARARGIVIALIAKLGLEQGYRGDTEVQVRHGRTQARDSRSENSVSRVTGNRTLGSDSNVADGSLRRVLPVVAESRGARAYIAPCIYRFESS
jgi:hypothetical protein